MAREIDLRACVVALPFDRFHRAFAELGVEHLPAGLDAMRGRRLLFGHRRAGEALAVAPRGLARGRVAAAVAERRTGKALLLRREPLERCFRQLVEETAAHVVAGLAVQQARLR